MLLGGQWWLPSTGAAAGDGWCGLPPCSCHRVACHGWILVRVKGRAGWLASLTRTVSAMAMTVALWLSRSSWAPSLSEKPLWAKFDTALPGQSFSREQKLGLGFRHSAWGLGTTSWGTAQGGGADLQHPSQPRHPLPMRTEMCNVNLSNSVPESGCNGLFMETDVLGTVCMRVCVCVCV